MKRFKTVNDYVAGASQWQAEIKRLREILLTTGLAEEVKWGAPCYTCDGRNVVAICGFKSYFGLWFYQGALLADDKNVLINAQEGTTRALRQWRMSAAKDIKPAVIRAYVKEATILARAGTKIGPQKKPAPVVPEELKMALSRNAKARKGFDELRPGLQREYIEHIVSAKREATKVSRIEKILPMMASGIGLNDKYR